MIPVSAISPFIRTQNFVTEEWDQDFSVTVANPNPTGDDGWKGVLMANRGLIAPAEAYDFFASDAFGPQWLDDGASRTLYLTLVAGKLFASSEW